MSRDPDQGPAGDADWGASATWDGSCQSSTVGAAARSGTPHGGDVASTLMDGGDGGSFCEGNAVLPSEINEDDCRRASGPPPECCRIWPEGRDELLPPHVEGQKKELLYDTLTAGMRSVGPLSQAHKCGTGSSAPRPNFRAGFFRDWEFAQDEEHRAARRGSSPRDGSPTMNVLGWASMEESARSKEGSWTLLRVGKGSRGCAASWTPRATPMSTSARSALGRREELDSGTSGCGG